MVQTDAVAVALCAANSVIDKMELATYVFGAQDLKDLAAYQAHLSAARTSQSEDEMFLEKFHRYFMVKQGKK
jgi:hypothetical protein